MDIIRRILLPLLLELLYLYESFRDLRYIVIVNVIILFMGFLLVVCLLSGAILTITYLVPL